MVEVIFLGVGAAIPMPGQTNASYLLRAGDACILVDCGPAIMQQLAGVGLSPSEITHLYFTHRHGDHALGYPMLMLWWSIYAPEGAQLPTVVGSDLTLQALDQMLLTAFGPDTAQKASAPHIALPQADSCLELTPSISLRALPLRHHDFAPVLGVRFEVGSHVIAFTGDTMPTPAIITLAQNADLLVHDSTYSATLNPETAEGKYGHSTAQIAARNAASANVKHLALVHLDATYRGKEATFIEEASHEFHGRISIPIAGTLYSF